MANARRIEALFGRIGLGIVSLAMLLLLSECTARAADAIGGVPFWGGDRNATLYMEHPFLYRVPRPGGLFQGYTVNRHGFRGADFALDKPPGVFRVLTLGGSAVWDTNVSDDAHTWSAQLQAKLKKGALGAGYTRVEVINGGVPGYTSAESFMNFVWRGLPLEPDAVIVYHGYNDFKPNRYPGFKSDYSHFRQLNQDPLQLLARHSRLLYHLLRLGSRFGSAQPKRYDSVAPAGIAAFQDNLRKLVTLARDRGIRPLLSTYAMSVTEQTLKSGPDKLGSMRRYLNTLSDRGVLDAHRRYNQAVRELGAALDVPVVDVASQVPADFVHFTDHCHFTDRGAERAAAAFAPAVRDLTR